MQAQAAPFPQVRDPAGVDDVLGDPNGERERATEQASGHQLGGPAHQLADAYGRQQRAPDHESRKSH